MKSKAQIIQKQVDASNLEGNMITELPDLHKFIEGCMDEYATEKSQSLAKEVIEELEKQIKINPYTDEKIPISDRQSALLGRVGALQLSVLIIKKKFKLS